MRYPSTPVRSALAFAGALFGFASAPTGRKLAVRTGAPIPFRIALPEEAEVVSGPGVLSTRFGEVLVVAAAKDMMQGEEEGHMARESLARRVLDGFIMRSDPLLYALLDEELVRRQLELPNAVRRIGTLGRQRAACLRSRFSHGGTDAWLEMHATVQDGIMYMLTFTVLSGDLAPHEALLARIHESFELP
jgi:hypothetical protein